MPTKLLILPGFSLKNKDWAEQTQKDLRGQFPTEVVYWQHWTTGEPEPDWLQKEADRIKEIANGQQTNILAKSIATAIAGILTPIAGKIILCGIPINDFLPGTEELYLPFKIFPAERVLCFQNYNDPHGSFAQAQQFLSTLNPAIKLIKKSRSDHEYLYSPDFLRFLSLN